MKKRPLLLRLAEGLVGAVVLTIAHETTRRNVSGAPRLDLLGERAITSGMRALGLKPPRGRSLRRWALAGDIAANTLYYAFVAKNPRTALIGGLVAGTGALTLPKKLGLREPRHHGDLKAQAIALALYSLGGLAAGAAFKGSRADGAASDAGARDAVA